MTPRAAPFGSLIALNRTSQFAAVLAGMMAMIAVAIRPVRAPWLYGPLLLAAAIALPTLLHVAARGRERLRAIVVAADGARPRGRGHRVPHASALPWAGFMYVAVSSTADVLPLPHVTVIASEFRGVGAVAIHALGVVALCCVGPAVRGLHLRSTRVTRAYGATSFTVGDALYRRSMVAATVLLAACVYAEILAKMWHVCDN